MVIKMDISKKYIEMCEKAIGMQSLWIPSLGDWVCTAEHCLRNAKIPRIPRVVQYLDEKGDMNER